MRTAVGVPLLGAHGEQVPPPSPSQTLVDLPDGNGAAPEANTAVDVKAMSNAEAERVLQWTGFTQEEIPTVSAAEAGTKKIATPPPAGVISSARATQRGVAPQAPIHTATGKLVKGGTPRAYPAPPAPTTAKGRATLLLDNSAPPMRSDKESDDGREMAPIVVPPAGAMVPKAVTQPPPWGEGAVQIARGIRPGRQVPPMRAQEPSVEELSGSILLPELDAADGDPAEELSGSMLLPDETGNPQTVPASTVPQFPRASSPSAPAPPPRGASSVTPPKPGVKTAPGYAMPRAHHGPTQPSPQASPEQLAGVRAAKSTLFGSGPSRPSPAQVHQIPVKSVPPPLAPEQHAPIMPPLPKPLGGPLSPPPPPAHFAGQPEITYAAAPPPRPSESNLVTLPVGVPVPPPIDLNLAPWPPPHAQGEVAHVPPQDPSVPADLAVTSVVPPRMSSVAPPEFAPPPGFGPPPSVAPPQSVVDSLARKVRLFNTNEFLAKYFPPGSVMRGPKPKWFLPAVAGGGFVVGVVTIATMVSLVRGFSGEKKTSTHASARASAGAVPKASTPPSATAAVTTAASAPSLAASTTSTSIPSTAACMVGGPSHTLAKNAMVGSGVEVVTLGDEVGIGFATGAHDGMVVRVDPSTFTAQSMKVRSGLDAMRRVSPLLTSSGKLDGSADSDKRFDHIQGRRTVAGSSPLDIGGAAGHFVVAPHGTSNFAKLWALDGAGDVEQARGVQISVADHTYAFAFRRAGAIWIGVASGDGSKMTESGPLATIAALGPGVGSPTISATGDTVLVAWADHSGKSDPYGVRFVRFKVGEAPGDASTFAMPPGGEGQMAMSPSVAGLPGGRFLLVWTEGPEGSHQVRAQTLRDDGRSLGDAFTVSEEGINAGQGQVASTGDGRSVVAFLASNAKSFDVVGMPITCSM